jgi:hypothetical protein
MSYTQKYFRLRIRTADDSADELSISSVPGDDNPYVLEPPDGDGQSFEPLSGSVTTGAYTIKIIDEETSADTRVLTSKLADANARQQLLNRKAYVEDSEDATTWDALVTG